MAEDNSKAPARSCRRTQDWSSAEKLRVVLESLKLLDAEVGAFLRREVLHEAEPNEWREAVRDAGREASEGQGRRHGRGQRDLIMSLVGEAVTSGCTQESACARVGISKRTLQRWRRAAGEDGRIGARTRPANALTEKERAQVLEIANSPGFRDLSPKEIVPRLSEGGEYYASKSTTYRLLRTAEQLAPRGRARPPTSRCPDEHVATGPNQVHSRDITYRRAAMAGPFFYLCLIVDIWSRKIVGWAVHEIESPVPQLVEWHELQSRLPPPYYEVRTGVGTAPQGGCGAAPSPAHPLRMWSLGIPPSPTTRWT